MCGTEGTEMLVLSRKQRESLVIGDGVVVTVVEIKGGRVRLAVEAPKEVSVHRQEIQEKIRRFAHSAHKAHPDELCCGKHG
jgi:carbon storage regulator